MRAVPLQAVGILLTVSCFLVFLFVPLHELLDGLSTLNILSPRPGISVPPMNVLTPRQGVSVTAPLNNSPTSTSSTTPASSTEQQKQTSSSTTPSSATSQQSSTSAGTPTAEQTTSSTPTSTQPTDTSTSTSTTPHSSVPPQTSELVTTNSGGQTFTSLVIASDTSTGSSGPSQTAAPPPSSGSSGVSSSTIIGLSVAGGVAVLGIIGFFVWKFTRKQRNEFNDNEEIKWPELNAHDASVPLPTHRTGGSGIDTADIRRNSVGYAASTAANSTAELYPDPYAVPPLPHLDPNQPYHDDPNARFYDPYNGPVPQTFEGGGAQVGESFPMTQLAGRRSPGPGAMLGGGRASPGPQGPYDFGGRASPAPQGAYGIGMGGRVSPGPGIAYAAGGRASPAPQVGYGNYGPR